MSQVSQMILARVRLDLHVVDICFHGFSQQRFENTGHHVLVSGLGILKTERHDVVTIHPCRCYEFRVYQVSGSDCSMSMRLERITAHVMLLHLLSYRCAGEETCLSGEHHLNHNSQHTRTIFHSSWGRLLCCPTIQGIESF